MIQQRAFSSLWEAMVSNSHMGQGCPLFDVVHPVPTTASPTLQGALKEGF